jgi:hypothetical protein
MAYSYIQDNGTVAICSLLSSVPEGAVYYEVNEFPDRAYRSAWNLQDGQVTLDPVKAAVVDADIADNQKRKDKVAGVLFEGVLCSATAEDMWGLSSIQGYVASGMDVPFKFNNGNVLVLTPSNMAAFQEVWVPFRASFFS